MKTPRDILLRRHERVSPRLDDLRQEALSKAFPEGPDRSGLCPNLWEFLCSLRWHWAGLGTAWLLVLLLNQEGSITPPQVITQQGTPTPVQLLSTLQEHRRQLLGWDDEQPANSERQEPAPVLPPRRSQLLITNLNCVV